MRSIICTAVIGILATVASANYEACTYKCAMDYSTCIQNSATADDYNNCALTLSTCQQSCVQLKATFSVADKIKTFAAYSEDMDEFKGADTNGDGLIDIKEFLAVFKPTSDLRRELLKQAFAQADTNGDKFLTYDEIEKYNADVSLIQKPQVTFDCTYRCGVYNTCMMKGAWNGDTTKCGSMPSGCKCIW